MKKVLILISVLTFGCSKLKKYELRIDYIGNSVHEHFETNETIHMRAYNDTDAYSIAVERCYLQIEGNRDVHPAIHIKSCIVKNEFGTDLDNTLSHKVRDSIDMHWKDHYSFDLKK
jgi:hypothetical protein